MNTCFSERRSDWVGNIQATLVAMVTWLPQSQWLRKFKVNGKTILVNAPQPLRYAYIS
jgi:hypothetical protein